MITAEDAVQLAAGTRLPHHSHVFEVRDPANGETVGYAPIMAASEVHKTIDDAEAAQRAWRARTAKDRSEILSRFATLMLQETERLATLLTREQGKPLAEAIGEIRYAAGFLEWSAGEARRIYGETIPAPRKNQRILVLKQPIGVAAAITPWNFPSAMITRKLGPALAAGCSMVVKPAEQTPLSAFALLDLAHRAGVPKGVFAVVTGQPGDLGNAIMNHPAVRMLSFTGSTNVGKLLMRKAADSVMRLGLELGGHAPFIVFDDAQLDIAVPAAIASKFRNAGQTCICANRFLVAEEIAEEFTERLKEAMEQLHLGHGLDKGVAIGPLIDDSAVAKVMGHISDAVDRGATLVTGGAIEHPNGLQPRFISPTLLTNVSPDMKIFSEETFGPVAPITTFRTEEEAVRLANSTDYGLAAYSFTRDASRLMRVSEALEYGIVGANDGAPSVPEAPFGGVKQSGLGREGGHYGLEEYLEVKYVSWRI